ncbi:MAG TPA: hypothetical protein VK849_05315, partial [Longimicrobiales bacterium]|nr:hypothetical protein [Longimicrobiales bacterium]
MTDHVPDWAPFDPGAPPELPRGADGDGRVVALVASRTLARAPWTGEAAASLARTWATGGLRVVLADAGLERPTLHEVFGVRNEEGLSDAVLWGASVQRVARPLPRDGFYVVTSGTPVPDGAAVFATERWGQLCVGFREAGVTLVALVPDGAPGWESVVAAATDVFILSERADDVREAASRGGDRVRGVFG